MKCFVVFIILILPVNALAMCINASDIMEDKIVDIVHADSSENQDPETGCSKYWVKSQVQLNDVKRIVKISDLEVNLCAKGGGSHEAESIEMNIGSIDPPIPSITLGFRQHDSVKFSSIAPYQGIVTEEMCDGSDPKFKTFDVGKCKQDFVGRRYTSLINNNVTSAQSNIVNFNNIPTSNLLDAPLYVLDPLDSDNKSVISKSVEFLSSHFSSGGDIWSAVCNYSPSNTYSSPEIESHIANIRYGTDAYSLNKICGNICHVNYDENGNQSIVSNACMFSISAEKGSNDTYFSYPPGLVVREGGSAGRELGTVGSLSPKGVQLNKEYKLQTPVPNVWMDIGRGGTGGYKILISRGCTYHNKRSLYYYVGDSCPTIMPGDTGSHPIEMIDKNDYVGIRTFALDPAWDGKSIYYGVKDNGDGESNNVGYFEMETRVPKEIKTPFATALNWVVDHVQRLLYADNKPSAPGAVGKIYQTFINGPFINVVQSALVLYIAVYALLYVMGMLRSSQIELMVIIVKIVVVMTVISPNSWEFFNTYLFQLFKEGSIDLVNIMSSHTEGDTGFKFIDRSLSRFAEIGTWVQIFSLIFTGPIGFIIAFAIVWGVWMLFLAILRAVIIFITSIVVIALLLSIAPLFITFVLFKRTKVIFDNWIKILANVALQPVIVFAVIAMLNNVIMGITYALLNYDVCTQCVATATIHDSIQGICILNTYLPRTYVATSTYQDLARETYDGFSFFGVPILFPSLIGFVILCHSLASFVQKVPEMVNDIFGVMATELSHPANKFEDSMRAVVGQDASSRNDLAKSAYEKKLRGDQPKDKDTRNEVRREKGVK